jgi:pimeloyl-ACP methyl ester carboxylesterase
VLGRPRLRRRNARLLRGAGRPVDEAGYIPAGGIDHFVTIRGASRDNPVLVFLHGGPGATQTVFAAQTLRWEDHVTVVQYDQRGSGKTRHRNGPAADGELSFDRLRLDATELIDTLRSRLGAAKVILAASSAGTTFGLHLAASRPDLLPCPPSRRQPDRPGRTSSRPHGPPEHFGPNGCSPAVVHPRRRPPAPPRRRIRGPAAGSIPRPDQESGRGTMDVTGVAWRTSSYSDSNGGTCVEVGALGPAVAVRDSKDQHLS